MKNDWQEASLGEIFNVKHGFAFQGQFFTDEQKSTLLVTPGNFSIGGGFQNPKPKFYEGPIPEEYVLKPGQIIVTMTDLSKESDTLGYSAIVPDDENTWLHNQRIGLLEFKGSFDADPTFINYLLRTQKYRSWIIGSASGTTVKHTSPARIQSFKCKIPPVLEQRAIAHILGSLDDKIELNRRINETLEAIASAIFKSWFVDFNPVRAKAEGRDTGLPGEIAELFPDSFEDSKIGEIPRGWKLEPIGEAVKCVGGSTPSTKNPAFWDGGKNPFVTPKDMSSLTSPVILDTSRHITDAGVDRISSGRLPIGTVILSSRAPIGYLAITEVRASVNQGVIAMICNKDLPNHYVLYWAETNMETIKSNAGGTTFAEISKRNFRPIQVVVPQKLVLDAFVQHVDPLHKQVVLNLNGSNSLASLRDTLLPKLIFGKLRVKDAEKFVEEAGL